MSQFETPARLSPVQDVRGLDTAVAASLAQHATEVYDDSRLTPMLRQLVRVSCGLGDAVGGSVSLVDNTAGRYTKVAEFGTACHLGQSLPVAEGITVAVLDRRTPVVLRSHRQISRGHLKVGHPAWNGAVAAVPIWWRAEIVVVNVIFAGVARVLSIGEIDDFTSDAVVAPGLVMAVERDIPDQSVRRCRRTDASVLPPAAGLRPAQTPGAAVTSVNDVVAGLIELTPRVTAADCGDVAPTTGMELKIIGDQFTTQFYSVGDELKVSEQQRQDAIVLCQQSDQRAALGCMEALATTDLRADLPTITVPTLVIHGDGDGVVPFEGSGDRTHAAIPQSELVMLAGAPRGCNLSHAAQFNEALVTFRHLRTSATSRPQVEAPIRWPL